VYTAHHDPGHCFEETLSGDFTVVVAGGWFPRHVLHRAMALCAYIRCLLAALWLAWTSFR
jgi:alpha-1,3/alpha-1,6-mannosyltransferase